MKIFVIIFKKYSFKWNLKIFIRFLINKKEMYSNEYFHSFFYSFIRILSAFIRHTRSERSSVLTRVWAVTTSYMQELVWRTAPFSRALHHLWLKLSIQILFLSLLTRVASFTELEGRWNEPSFAWKDVHPKENGMVLPSPRKSCIPRQGGRWNEPSFA